MGHSRTIKVQNHSQYILQKYFINLNQDSNAVFMIFDLSTK